MKEIWEGLDSHEDNRKRFELPTRLIAKTFLFRIIYGGSAFSYANDNNFKEVSSKESFWQGVIDEFYNKYEGLAQWHKKLVQTVIETNGTLTMPTGRVYQYTPEFKRGTEVWPRTTILNYPVQGLGADLMAIARVSLWNRLLRLNLKDVKLVNTVHDSIIFDCAEYQVKPVIKLTEEVFEDIPKNFERLFGLEFNLPMRVECLAGPNWKDVDEVK